MAGIIKGGYNSIAKTDWLLVVDRGEKRKGSTGIILGIKRDFLMRSFSFFFFVPSLLKCCVLFLNVCGIKKYYLRNFRSGIRTVDFTFESLPDELGNQAAVVEMGMSKQYGVD